MLNFLKKYKELPDEALMKRLQNQDSKACEEIYLRHYKPLLFFCLKMLNNKQSMAEDVVQDVFVKLVEFPKMFRLDMKFKPWIYTLAANECRKVHRLKHLLPFQEFTIIQNPVDEKNETLSGFIKILDIELNKLSDLHKEVFLLKHIQNFSLNEISLIQNCPVGTVKSRLHKSTKILSQNLLNHKHLLTS